MFIGSALTFIRNTLANIVMLLLLILIFTASSFIGQFKDNGESINQRNTNQTAYVSPVLYLDLGGVISETPLATGGIEGLQRHVDETIYKRVTHSILDIEKALVSAAFDPAIKLVLLNLSNMQPVSMAVASRIAQTLTVLKQEGKQTAAIATSYTQSSYAIAAHADKIYMDPLGSVDIHGMSLQSLYFAELLQKAQITPYVMRAGEFKSAVEPFLRSDMSSHVKAEYAELIEDLWSNYLNSIRTRLKIENRKLPQKFYPDVSSLYSSKSVNLAEFQKEIGLVDELMPYYFYQDTLIEQYGHSPFNRHLPDIIDYREYVKSIPVNRSRNKIAVIYGIGPIVDKSEIATDFAPDAIIPLIEKAMHDPDIHAVVFYINSPGGSLFASEQIRRALIKLRKTKSVIISMNGQAASGGYFLATQSDAIIATNDTITGSIGVFALSFGAHNLLNSFGVYQDGVSNSDFASVPVAKAPSQDYISLMQKKTENSYEFFIDLVSKARELDYNDYPTYAEGKIFIAQKALELKLIDKIGTLHDAIELAKILCNKHGEEFEIVHMKQDETNPFSSLETLIAYAYSAGLPAPLARLYLEYRHSAFVKSALETTQGTVMAITPFKNTLN